MTLSFKYDLKIDMVELIYAANTGVDGLEGDIRMPASSPVIHRVIRLAVCVTKRIAPHP